MSFYRGDGTTRAENRAVLGINAISPGPHRKPLHVALHEAELCFDEKLHFRSTNFNDIEIFKLYRLGDLLRIYLRLHPSAYVAEIVSTRAFAQGGYRFPEPKPLDADVSGSVFADAVHFLKEFNLSFSSG